MRLAIFLLFVVSLSSNANELGCQDPSGTYHSREGALLEISQELEVGVFNQNGQKLFLGEIVNFDSYKVSEYNHFANSPEIHSADEKLGKWAIMHIGENCQGIKMVWFLGSEFRKRKLVGKYYFEKNT